MFPILFALMSLAIGPIAPETPAHEPQIAASASLVALTFGAGNSIYFTSSRDSGRSFSPPVRVAAVGILPLSRHRGPHIALADGAIVITAVAGSHSAEGTHAHGLPSDGDLLVWRSTDGGKTWVQGKPINDVPASATEGLHALASDGHRTLVAVWLDHRGGKGTRLYAARSLDAGATWSRNVDVYQSPDGSICECCAPSAAVGPDGEIRVMFRNSLGGSRDLYLTASRDGLRFSKPQKLGAGTWHINACPMDGGGLAVSSAKVVTAWRREGNVFLDDPGQPELRIGTGKDVALALAGGRSYVAWVNGSQVELWNAGKLETIAPSGAYPALTAIPSGGVLAAWEEAGAIRLRRLP